MTSTLVDWALPQLTRLLPLDEDSLKQIITYSDTLPKDAAAEHLKNLLGDAPQALEFISSFNTRRQAPPAAHPPVPPPNSSEVPKGKPRQTKKKTNIHSLPARQLADSGDVGRGYNKHNEEDYIAGSSRQRKAKEPPLANALALQEKPDAIQAPTVTSSSKPPPSAAGPLISDLMPAPKSAKSSRTSSPAPSAAKTKISIAGGTPMHGASTALSDLDSAIRSLEIQTNPTFTSGSSDDMDRRRCNCMATRHPLLTIAPNCTSCGKIVCVKEGLGPCTFCSKPILSPEDVQGVLRILKDERGKERQTAQNATHKRADVSSKPRAFTGRDFLSSATSSAANSRSTSPFAAPSRGTSTPASDAESEVETGTAKDETLSQAKAHRDRLLAFQSQNARRTRIHDEAADYDMPVSGTNMWASPAERARELKKQQKILREMEWNSRPEYEKRKTVASIEVDKSGRSRVVRRVVAADRPAEEEEDHGEDDGGEIDGHGDGEKGVGGNAGGAFSQNPLLGSLIRPIAPGSASEEKGKRTDGLDGKSRKKNTWRRVQDDRDDNEEWILDGGMYGGRIDGRVLGSEEHAIGATA